MLLVGLGLADRGFFLSTAMRAIRPAFLYQGEVFPQLRFALCHLSSERLSIDFCPPRFGEHLPLLLFYVMVNLLPEDGDLGVVQLILRIH